MRNLLLVLLVVVMAASGLLFGCGEPSTPTTTTPTTTAPTTTTPTTTAPTTTVPTTTAPQYGGTLRILNEPIPPIIGWPLDMQAGPAGAAVQGVLETLLRANPQGGVYGWLAESYEVEPNAPSITFKLRQGIKFHDGSDFNAEVVKWNLDTWIEAKAKRLWKSVDIVDDYTVRVNLDKWQNTVPLEFCENIAPVQIISKQAFDTNGLDWVKFNPVGTGPFIFEEFTPDVSLKIVKNPDYWVDGKPYLDAVEMTFIGDPVTLEMVLKSGDADMGYTSLDKAAGYEELGFTVFMIPEAIWVFCPDTANPDSPWANQKVREAVEYAIDRGAMAKTLGYGYLEAPYQIAPRSSVAFNPDFPYKRGYDPDKARQLLTEAGYPDGFDTTIYQFPPSGDDYLLTVQALLSQVGINVDIDHTDWGKWGTYMGPGSWPENGCLYSPIPRFDRAFLGGLQFTFSRYGQSWLRTPEAIQALDAAFAPLNPDIELVRAVVNLIGEKALLIPVHEGAWNRVTAPGVHTEFDQRGYILFWDIEDAWLEK